MTALAIPSTLDTEKVHRVVVPVPDNGWLSLLWPETPVDRLALARDWRAMAARSCVAARVPFLGRARLQAEVKLRRFELGLNVAEDVRPALIQVVQGLADAGVVSVDGYQRPLVDEHLTLGHLTGEHEPLLILHLWRWDGG